MSRVTELYETGTGLVDRASGREGPALHSATGRSWNYATADLREGFAGSAHPPLELAHQARPVSVVPSSTQVPPPGVTTDALGPRHRILAGCVTCRIRKKKCLGPRVGGQGACLGCHDLNIECGEGYGRPVPREFRDQRYIGAIKRWNKRRANRRGEMLRLQEVLEDIRQQHRINTSESAAHGLSPVPGPVPASEQSATPGVTQDEGHPIQFETLSLDYGSMLEQPQGGYCETLQLESTGSFAPMFTFPTSYPPAFQLNIPDHDFSTVDGFLGPHQPSSYSAHHEWLHPGSDLLDPSHATTSQYTGDLYHSTGSMW